MAKKIKMNDVNKNIRFQQFYEQQPEEFRQMLDEFNVNSFESLLELSMMMGIDIDKVEKFYKENGDDKLPSMEDVMFDDDDPAGDYYRWLMDEDYGDDEEDYDDEEDDEEDDKEDYDNMPPFILPKKIFFEEQTAQKYHLRIKLNNAPVPIWREVEVPSNISLEFFAFVIIEAMGWMNYHLHQFKKGNLIYQNLASAKDTQDIFTIFNSPFSTRISDDYPLSDIFKEKGDRIKFEYDFGDCWNHDIWLKGISEYQPDEAPMLKIIKGKGMCPPEDCGGVYGYSDLLDILSKKRKSAEDKESLAWYGIDKEFDPNEFNIEWIEDNLDALWIEATEE